MKYHREDRQSIQNTVNVLSAVLLAVLLAASGCAGQAGPAQPVGKRDDGKVDAAGGPVHDGEPVPPITAGGAQRTCHYEKATGSHMMRKICLTDAERRQMEQDARQWVRTGGRSGGVATVRDPGDPRIGDDEK